ncbi:MAG: YfiR family protein [Burkholderiales bacterium]|nr:YfiR family protein [Burkholderiales bacterium]MDE2394264.1 YfiR family protein [Burkholderiales bacterium]MDE2452574.1 YfiR family protein [Burkholderiales bacterium]
MQSVPPSTRPVPARLGPPRPTQWLLRALGLLAAASWALLAALPARADDLPEYRLKAAFVYNFIQFTEWPADASAGPIVLCIVGADPFGSEADLLRGKTVGGRAIDLRRLAPGASLRECEVVFVAAAAIDRLAQIVEALHARPVLLLADSPGAMQAGVMVNMLVADGRVRFEANLRAARTAHLNLSSKLLRLATEVRQ